MARHSGRINDRLVSAQLVTKHIDSEHRTKRVKPSHHEGLRLSNLLPKRLSHQLPKQLLNPCLSFRQQHVVPSWTSRL